MPRPDGPPTIRPRPRRLRAVAALLAVLCVLPALAATPAAADATFRGRVDSCNYHPEPCTGTNVRWSPRLGAASYGVVPQGTELTAVCQIRGEAVTDSLGYRTDIWSLVELEPGREWGYVSEVYFGRHGFVLQPCPGWRPGHELTGTADTCEFAGDPCSGVYVRNGPKLAAEVIAELPQGAQRRTKCQTPGERIHDRHGWRSNVWNHVEYEPGQYGWVSDTWWGRHGFRLNDCYPYGGGAPATGTPAATVDPARGDPSTRFVGGGSGFSPSGVADLTFYWPSGGEYPTRFARPVAADGNFYWQWVWEPGDEYGTYRMTAVDRHTGRRTELTFTIDPPAASTPILTVQPLTGDRSTTFRGGATGFTPGGRVILHATTPSGAPYHTTYPLTAGADGTLHWRWIWEPGDADGTYRISAVDEVTGQRSGEVALTITDSEAGGGDPPPAPAGAAFSDSCPGYMVIGAEGSGSDGPGPQGRGPVEFVYNRLRDSQPGLITEPLRWLDYPAARVPIVSLDLSPFAWTRFYDSFEQGRRNMRLQYVAQVARCPGTRYFMIGFSQGAGVIGDFLQELGPQEAPRVVGTVLLGDPFFNPSDASSRHAWFHSDLYPGFMGRRPRFQPPTAARVRSYCTYINFPPTLDPVCGIPDAGINLISAALISQTHLREHYGAYGIEAGDFLHSRLREDAGLNITYKLGADGAGPTAVLGDEYVVAPGSDLVLHAGASEPAGSEIIEYRFDLDADGHYEQVGPEPVADVRTATEAVIPVRLEVVDETGATGSTTSVIRVTADAPQPPAAPEAVQASAVPDGVRITWRAVEGDPARTVYRVLLNTGQPVAVTAGEVTEALDVGVVPGGTYSYRVEAITARGVSRSAPSNQVNPQTVDGGSGDGASDNGRIGSANTPAGAAVAISQRRFPNGDGPAHAVLSRDDDFPDSLAGAALSSHGPLLLTDGDALNSEVAAELGRVLPAGGMVYLLGGEQALSADLEEAVADLGLTPVRLAGGSRLETALEVADEVRRLNPGVERVAVARAFGTPDNPTAAWADSVMGGAWAARTGTPVLLTGSHELHPAVVDWLGDDRPDETLVLGGTSAVSAEVEALLPSPTRAAGDGRAGTAAEVAGLWPVAPRGWTAFNSGRADGWAYGLAAAGLAADRDAPLVVVGDDIPHETAALVGSCPTLTTTVVGGEAVVVGSVEDELARLARSNC